ncbi:hypothetical protein HYX14_06030 [Candidatus Woesearchaeota archaeon]|nr:hypothetical protein [Candidatus Woesearchaeota archaeon]
MTTPDSNDLSKLLSKLLLASPLPPRGMVRKECVSLDRFLEETTKPVLLSKLYEGPEGGLMADPYLSPKARESASRIGQHHLKIDKSFDLEKIPMGYLYLAVDLSDLKGHGYMLRPYTQMGDLGEYGYKSRSYTFSPDRTLCYEILDSKDKPCFVFLIARKEFVQLQENPHSPYLMPEMCRGPVYGDTQRQWEGPPEGDTSFDFADS